MKPQIPWLRVFVEGVVIVGSILLAFGLQAWWDERGERQTELTILGELHTALSADLELLELRLDRFRRIESRGAFLLSHLRSGAPYADSLDAYFGTVYGFAYSQLNRGGYESLKSQGPGLISDDDLRSHVARVYEQTYPRVEDSMDQERSAVLEVLRPYFLAYFRDLRSNESATPLNYQMILGDTEFLNSVDYRLQAVTRRDIPRFGRAISEIRALIDSIEVELGR